MTSQNIKMGSVWPMSSFPLKCLTAIENLLCSSTDSANVPMNAKSSERTSTKGRSSLTSTLRFFSFAHSATCPLSSNIIIIMTQNYPITSLPYYKHTPIYHPSHPLLTTHDCALYNPSQSNITITMSIFKLFKKKQHGGQVQQKLNVSTVFNREEEVKTSQNNKNLQYNSSKQRRQHFQLVLKAYIVDLEKLKQLSWNGIPQSLRSSAWKLLLKYMPTNQDTQLQTLQRKRKEYFVMVNTYIENPSLQQDAQEKKIFKLINDDVLRTLPESNLFRNQRIQKIMRRLLYVWHMRHPASGYVQGINDVATPFIVVFLSEYIEVNLDTLDLPSKLEEVTDEQLANVQGDSYYCLSKILDGILDNYTSSWPGIQKSFVRIEEVIKRVDPDLLAHFSAQNIDFYHMYFKWVTCLLLRQFSMKTCLRLFDTYLAIQNNYFGFCLYILAAIMLKYSKKFKKMGFEEMMIFQQNMPTKEWTQEDLATVIAEAYVYQSYFVK